MSSQHEILDPSVFKNNPRKLDLPECEGLSVNKSKCRNRASIKILDKALCKNHAGSALVQFLLDGRLIIGEEG